MQLSYQKIKHKTYKYKLSADYVFTLPTSFPPLWREVETKYLWFNGVSSFILKQEYAWDGPTFPAIATRNFVRGSLVHDGLYQLMRLGYLDKHTYRPHADRVLYTVIREDGMWAVRALWVYWAVRIGANGAARRKLDPTIQ
jgi:hypothetical protein